MSEIFEWVDFPEGQAKFCGSLRGVDELGHDAFAIRLFEWISYGEFEYRPCQDAAESTINIKKFGYGDKTNFGNQSAGSRAYFRLGDIATISNLIVQLMVRKSSKPFPLHKVGDFRGKVIFSDGWVQVTV